MEIVNWLREAAERGDAGSQYRLGLHYMTGRGMEKEAAKWLRKAAEQNNPDAQYCLGIYYDKSLGNQPEAARWYRKAAEQNHAQAQNNLGSCYLDGLGVPKNEVEAVSWFRKAAEQNSPLGQHNLGICYLEGDGVGKDEVEAYKWLLLASAQGREDSTKVIAELEPRLTRAQLAEGQKRAGESKWLEDEPDEGFGAGMGQLGDLRAKAEAGNAQAQNELGEVLYAGKQGAPRNPVQAAKWFRKAAEQKDPVAQYNLANCYERGHGVPKHEAEAYKWALVSAAQGNTRAKATVSILELLLSQKEIADGKQWASNWIEHLPPLPQSPVRLSEPRAAPGSAPPHR